MAAGWRIGQMSLAATKSMCSRFPVLGPSGRFRPKAEGRTSGHKTVGSCSTLNGSQMMAVDIETEPTFRAGTPRLLFEGGVLSRGTGSTATYDVTADGQRFVMLRNVSSEARINIVQNWFEELRQRVPTE